MSYETTTDIIGEDGLEAAVTLEAISTKAALHDSSSLIRRNTAIARQARGQLLLLSKRDRCTTHPRSKTHTDKECSRHRQSGSNNNLKRKSGGRGGNAYKKQAQANQTNGSLAERIPSPQGDPNDPILDSRENAPGYAHPALQEATGFRWAGLPNEVRMLVLQALIQDGCALGRLATVSREWQTEIERHNFARIKVTPSRLVDFGSMIHRNRALVDYIWFCLELDEYDCTKCVPARGMFATDEEWEEAFSISDADGCPITTAFQNLFSILSTWDPNGHLVLDISIHSPSDSKHWFKYLTFMPDVASDMLEQTITNKACNDPQHGWVAGFRHSAPPSRAIDKIFHAIMEEGPFDSEKSELQWWDQLPSVPAVTSLLLRQQNRRRWKPTSLAHMFARFPRLQEVHYEPWREWDWLQRHTDTKFQYLFESIPRSNNNLKRLVVFENFNQQYPAIMQQFQFGVDLVKCDGIRNPAPAVSRTVALASLKLEHLAASFIVDASHFFEIDPSWEWSNLTSIVLTSKLFTPEKDPVEIGVMLQAAAAAAKKMPQLETMEIWNGGQGLAALFKYQVFPDRQEATITWRGTWNFTMESSLIQAWEAVIHQYDGCRLNLVQERLNEAAVKSHGDAIHYLMLSSQVIRPISLQQIQMEQKFLEGVPT
ncbi:hypothetical protein LTR10_022641 [Elasticomyces elasticus]|uniref:DUF6546 domain-containing protein n=1 Tax=Exophiala sideris TaxID=1016849 RepID=A0ABR0IX99_9EURO|nr:hypothetical protein LTR10_022641 [Elasticomyces elasticus]KAK5021919.1 hypothetical protein LTS07_010501 [Exophiala sideris]KAK5025982.1 hypothetical protein LTR13_010139 [Exophiala sideris]KAK5050669.1 hypothetical protein LTR69_010525 [Exophiala sideris]KAK5177154.1 hypothetical protein LTR44_010282 [Eurotiomycetes sp. CCFEE 6388]